MALRALKQSAKCFWTGVQQHGASSWRLNGVSVLPSRLHMSLFEEPSSRCFHGSVNVCALPDTLKTELADAKQHEPDPVLEEVPNGFTLEETPGSCKVTLRKTFGSEQVSVECSLVDQTEDEDMQADEEDDEAEIAPPVSFRVRCTKGDQILTFDCLHVEGTDMPPEIQHVSIEPKGGFPQDKEADMYSGPVKQELDPALQDDLAAYIEERGVNAELAQWLCCMNYEKEHQEYTAWLQKMQKYIQG